MVLTTLRSRYIRLAADDRIKQIQVYKNKGLFAGASLRHSHMQIIATPFPTDQWKGAVAYASEKGRCLLCDTVDTEHTAGPRLVAESEHFVALCPYAARFSYETWIVPKEHTDYFGSITDEQIAELVVITKQLTTALVDELGDPSYNFVLSTPPVNSAPNRGYHWYLEVFPRLIVQAGVELATGFYMNPISPEWAAETLRKRMG
jgi:UDPglucose--hexose-1-phosphate uridylyltransferase